MKGIDIHKAADKARDVIAGKIPSAQNFPPATGLGILEGARAASTSPTGTVVLLRGEVDVTGAAWDGRRWRDADGTGRPGPTTVGTEAAGGIRRGMGAVGAAMAGPEVAGVAPDGKAAAGAATVGSQRSSSQRIHSPKRHVMTSVETAQPDAGVPAAVGARRVLCLAAATALGAGMLWWAAIAGRTVAPLVRGGYPLLIAALVILAELCKVDVYIRRETHTISLSTIPLVIGLFVLSPNMLLVAYVVGASGVLIVRRIPRSKLIFNAAVFVAEVTVAVAVFNALAGRGGVREPRTWLAAILATVTIEVLSGLLVSTAIWLHQGHFDVDGFGWLCSAASSPPPPTCVLRWSRSC